MANQPKKYKKFVATAATATLVASAIVSVASAAEFKDVTGNDHEVAINALAEEGIIKGYADGTFKPNQTVTRGQVVKLLGRWLETLGEEVPADWKTEQRFTDVATSNQDEELVKYAALTKDAGVFAGSNGNLNATQTMTRQQMALVLVRAIKEIGGVDLVAEYKENGHVTEMADLDKAHGAEQRNAIVALEYAGITKVSVFNPNNSITRGQFASFLYRTINVLEDSEAGVASIKAINNTTVEVTFDDEVDNIQALHFTASDLEVKNAAVKQTNKKVVVLTTAAQTADKEYTVSLNEEKVGSFKGIAAVIPTKVDVKTSSIQGVIGNEVTLQAEVSVAEGQSKVGIPVTFNIVSDNSNVNNKVEVEVLTDDKGVASYSYTRYYSHNDNVSAYATQKSSIYDSAKVYWDTKVQLTVSEITIGNELANETKKSYKVVGKTNSTYYVAIKENINVAPDKVTKVKVQNAGSATFVEPYELTTGGTQFATVTTNSNGEGTFTVYGSNLSATPIVYAPESTPASANATTVEKLKYDKKDLQAQAPTVKFSQIDRLALALVAEGTADSAEYANVPVAYDTNSAGGRTYTVTVTDKDGKLAPAGTVAYVAFEKDNIFGDVYFSTGTSNFVKVTKDSVPQAIIVENSGKAKFRVAGKGATTYVKPTVFLNTAGDVSPVKLDKEDVQQVADVTFFKAPVVTNATLTVKDKFGRTVSSLSAGEDAVFTYQSVDQNGFAYRPTTTTGSTTTTIWKPITLPDGTIGYKQEVVTIPGGSNVTEYTLAFDVTSTFGNAIVKNAAGATLQAIQNLGSTKTYSVKSDATGKAIVRITNESADTVSVNVTGASNILPTQTSSVSFVNSSIVPDLYSGVVESYNSEKGKLKFQGKQEVDLYGSNILYTKGTEVIANYDAFVNLLKTAPGPVAITRTVKDGVTTFNIYNIATTGGGPTDTAIPTPLSPVTNAAFIDTDKDAGEIAGEITFTASTTANVTTKVFVGGTEVAKDANGKYIVAENTVAAPITIVVTNATGQSVTTTVNYTDNKENESGVTVGSLKEAGTLTFKVNPVTNQISVLIDSTKLSADLAGKTLELVVGTEKFEFKANQFKPTQIEVANTNFTETQLTAAKIQAK